MKKYLLVLSIICLFSCGDIDEKELLETIDCIDGCNPQSGQEEESESKTIIIKGTPGREGAQGIQGEQGSTGETGSTGEQGPKGETGSQGSQGPQGNDGLDGLDGIDGQDAIVEVINPCGEDPNNPDEIIINFADGVWIAWYKNVGLYELELDVVYQTTDAQQCKFKITENGYEEI